MDTSISKAAEEIGLKPGQTLRQIGSVPGGPAFIQFEAEIGRSGNEVALVLTKEAASKLRTELNTPNFVSALNSKFTPNDLLRALLTRHDPFWGTGTPVTFVMAVAVGKDEPAERLQAFFSGFSSAGPQTPPVDIRAVSLMVRNAREAGLTFDRLTQAVEAARRLQAHDEACGGSGSPYSPADRPEATIRDEQLVREAFLALADGDAVGFADAAQANRETARKLKSEEPEGQQPLKTFPLPRIKNPPSAKDLEQSLRSLRTPETSEAFVAAAEIEAQTPIISGGGPPKQVETNPPVEPPESASSLPEHAVALGEAQSLPGQNPLPDIDACVEEG